MSEEKFDQVATLLDGITPPVADPPVVTDPPATPIDTTIVVPPAEVIPPVETPVAVTKFSEITSVDTPPAVPVVELPEDVKTKLADYDKLQADIAARENDPVWKLLNSNLTIDEILEKGKRPDFSRTSFEELITDKVKEVFKEDPNANLQEIVDAELASYQAKTPLEQKQSLNGLRTEASAKFNTKDDVIKLIEEASAAYKTAIPQVQTVEQVKAQMDAIVSKDLSEIDAITARAKGTEFHNLILDDAMLAAVKKAYSMTPFINDKQELDVKQFMEVMLTYQNLPLITAKAIADATPEIVRKAIEPYINPDNQIRSTATGTASAEDVAKDTVSSSMNYN